jgi:hypothetical protein
MMCLLFNVNFSSDAAGVFDKQENFEGFAFRCVEEDKVFAASHNRLGVVEADGFSLKFIKIVLPTFFLYLLACSIFQSPLLHLLIIIISSV